MDAGKLATSHVMKQGATLLPTLFYRTHQHLLISIVQKLSAYHFCYLLVSDTYFDGDIGIILGQLCLGDFELFHLLILYTNLSVGIQRPHFHIPLSISGIQMQKDG
jgi:hypothetical protein